MTVSLAAARFVAAGAAGWMTTWYALPRGGLVALFGPLFVIAATMFWAAGALPLGVRGRTGFAIAAVITAFGSLLALVSTQAMTGRESGVALLVLVAVLAGVSAFGGAVGMVIAIPAPSRAFTHTLFAFVWGGAASGLMALGFITFGSLSAFFLFALLPLPTVVAGITAAATCRQEPVRAPSS